MTRISPTQSSDNPSPSDSQADRRRAVLAEFSTPEIQAELAERGPAWTPLEMAIFAAELGGVLASWSEGPAE
jgi:hypothetical protein